MDWMTSLFGSGPSLYGGETASLPGSTTGFDTSGIPALTTTTPTAGAGGDWFSSLMSGLGTAARGAGPVLGLGTAGLGLYSGIKGMQEAANLKEQNQESIQTQRQAANTALGSGQTLTNAGTSAMMGGPLPEGLEADAQQWEDSYRAQVRNYLAKAGMTTSSAMTQWEPYIKQQAAIYRQQLAAGLIQPGQNALNIASGSAARAVGSNQATQTGIGGALEAANRALASLEAASGSRERPRRA